MNGPLKIALGTLAGLVIFGAGVMMGRHWPIASDDPVPGPVRAGGKTVTGARAAAPEPAQKPRYRATTRFQINRISVPDVFSNSGIPPDMLRGDWFETQVKALTARSTLMLAVKNLRLDAEWKRSPQDAATRLAGLIEVEREPDTDIVSLSAWSDKARQAVAIADGVRGAYAQKRKEAGEERLRRLNEAVSSQIKQQEATVEESRREMLELMKKHNIVDVVPLSSGARPQPADVPAAANLPESGEASETPSEADIIAFAAERQKQSGYATRTYRYESQVQLLNSIREHAEKQAGETGSRNLIGILEPAVAVEDP